MEARKEVAPMPEREEKKPDTGELSESDLENAAEFDVEKDRERMVQDKRKRLASEYKTLREPLLELRVANDEKSKAVYEKIRTKFLMQVIEEYARADLQRTSQINKLARVDASAEIGTNFPRGIQMIIDKVSAEKDFNERFDTLLEQYPEGEKAIPETNELIAEFFKKKAEESKQEQIHDSLQPAFDEIKGMNEDSEQSPSPTATEQPKKKGLLERVQGLFGGK